MTHMWKVVSLSPGQKLDVREKDMLAGDLYRVCDTYRGGGGYDHFPKIAGRWFGEENHHLQFIVQLYGCNLDCPYCYVTREGVWGKPTKQSTRQLVEWFVYSGATVFHLMGGAPALQMKHWPDLIDRLYSEVKGSWLFHSDLLLSEGVYDPSVLMEIARDRCIYAVNIKGLTEEEHYRNTRKHFQSDLMWFNLRQLINAAVPFYITFTAVNAEHVKRFWNDFCWHFPQAYSRQRENAYNIDLIQYKALPHVDDRPWGAQR